MSKSIIRYKHIVWYSFILIDPDQKDSTGWTGSHWAVAMSRIDLLELYIDFGADINKAKTDGKTPLHIACEIGDAEMVLFLLQRGVDLESRAGVDGYTPLHLSTKGNFKECIEVLALAGADINASTLYGKQTPLHVACVMGHYESVLSLINVSHDPIRVCRGYEQLLIDAEDADGWSPYAMAQFKKHQRIIDLLDSAGSRKRSTGLR